MSHDAVPRRQRLLDLADSVREEWESMMRDEGVKAAIVAVNKACDEEGVPIDAHVLAEIVNAKKQ